MNSRQKFFHRALFPFVFIDPFTIPISIISRQLDMPVITITWLFLYFGAMIARILWLLKKEKQDGHPGS